VQSTLTGTQAQLPPPDGTVVGSAPATVGAEAVITGSQSIDVPPAQQSNPSQNDLTTDSGGTNVPAEFRFDETQYEPPAGITTEELSKLSDNDFLTGLKKQYAGARESYVRFGRDLDSLVKFYDATVARYSCERVSKNRNGKPTLEQAFLIGGWSYEAARKMKQRYSQSTKALPVYAAPPKPLQLTQGDKVKAGNGDEGVVQNVHQSAEKVDVLFQGHEEAVTLPTSELKKLVVPIKKIQKGDLVVDQVTGAEYLYDGNGKLSRTKTPTLLEKQRERELKTLKAKQEREKAETEDQMRRDDCRKAEAARRDLEKIATAQAKKEVAQKKKAAATAAKALKQADKMNAKSANRKELVKVARIGQTDEFGVFSESCFDCNTATALTIGTRRVCEAERDRINATRKAKASDHVTETPGGDIAIKQNAVAVI
jgi:hypothetical protein